MGRSFGRLNAATAVEHFANKNRFYHAASRTWFEMAARGEYFERRYQIGYGGETTNVAEARIDYFLGSANHARSYLHRTGDGRLRNCQ